MLDAIWLELPCPTCGEYALEGEVVLRDVSLRVRPQEGGKVAVDVANADAQLAAAACHACGEEMDLHGDVDIAEALENAAEAWLGERAD
jgi:hypothetical protein